MACCREKATGRSGHSISWTTSAMQQVFEVNTFLPMRVLASLAPVLKRSAAPRIAVLSARVG